MIPSGSSKRQVKYLREEVSPKPAGSPPTVPLAHYAVEKSRAETPKHPPGDRGHEGPNRANIFHRRCLELVPNERIVELVEFESEQHVLNEALFLSPRSLLKLYRLMHLFMQPVAISSACKPPAEQRA